MVQENVLFIAPNMENPNLLIYKTWKLSADRQTTLSNTICLMTYLCNRCYTCYRDMWCQFVICQASGSVLCQASFLFTHPFQSLIVGCFKGWWFGQRPATPTLLWLILIHYKKKCCNHRCLSMELPLFENILISMELPLFENMLTMSLSGTQELPMTSIIGFHVKFFCLYIEGRDYSV